MINKYFRNSLIKQFCVYFLLIFFGIIIGYYANNFFSGHDTSKINQKYSSVEYRQGQRRFTNHLLECKESQVEFLELRPFKNKIEDLTSDLIEKKEIDHISVYFRDLNNGPWFGIDEQAAFSPASLLKVPLSIAYFKLAESEPELLNRKLLFQKSAELPFVSQNITPKENLQPGQEYTVEDLIFRMLAYSDNDSYSLLLEGINFKDLARVYKDFGINLDNLKNTDEIVNVHNYSGFFRILYNSSYLTQDNSEKILSMLAASDFKNGIVGSVPNTIDVAHKFGERGSKDSNKMQFSDCGIIYYPSHPYLLCVMTKGTDIQTQISAIKEISSKVYKSVDEQN